MRAIGINDAVNTCDCCGPMQSLAVLLDWNIVKTEKLDDLFE